MKKLINLLLILLVFASCEKSYTYVEFANESGFLENKEIILKAKNDSVAYFEAYQKFCISLSSEAMVRKTDPDYSRIIGFALYDKNDNKIITPFPESVVYVNEEDLETTIFNMMGIDEIAKTKLSNFKMSELANP